MPVAIVTGSSSAIGKATAAGISDQRHTNSDRWTRGQSDLTVKSIRSREPLQAHGAFRSRSQCLTRR